MGSTQNPEERPYVVSTIESPDRARTKQAPRWPSCSLQPRLAAQLAEKIQRIGQAFPDLRQEGRPRMAIFEIDAVDARTKLRDRVGLARDRHRGARRTHR